VKILLIDDAAEISMGTGISQAVPGVRGQVWRQNPSTEKSSGGSPFLPDHRVQTEETAAGPGAAEAGIKTAGRIDGVDAREEKRNHRVRIGCRNEKVAA